MPQKRLFHDIEPTPEVVKKPKIKRDKTLSIKRAMLAEAAMVLTDSIGKPVKERLKLGRRKFPLWINPTPYRRRTWNIALKTTLGMVAMMIGDESGTFFEEKERDLL